MMVELLKNRTEQFRDTELDLEAWRKLYYKYQQAYIRKRLSAIKYLYEGKSRLQVCSLIGSRYNTLTSWIDKYLDGGLQGLVEPIKHQKAPQRLSPEQKQELKQIILEQSPRDYGISRNIWTGEIMIEVIQRKWNVSFKSSRVYEILQEVGLSYQRAHRDYANAAQAEQKAFVEVLKKNWKLSKKRKKSSSSMNLPSMTVPVCSMGGQK